MTDILAQSIRQAVRKPEVIEAMCQALEAQLRQSLGGDQGYIAKRPDRTARAELIKSQFTGDNYAELAETHHLTARRIRQIVHKDVKK